MVMGEALPRSWFARSEETKPIAPAPLGEAQASALDAILHDHRLPGGGGAVAESKEPDAESSEVRESRLSAARLSRMSGLDVEELEHSATTFQVHQLAAAARRIIELSQGDRAHFTIFDRLERVRHGHATDHHRGALLSSSTSFQGGGSAGPSSNSGYEGYQYEVDESRVHFEMRTEGHASRHQLSVMLTSFSFVVGIGLLLGLISTAITACEGLLINARNHLVSASFAEGSSGGAYAVFAAFNTLFIGIAALLTYWAPQAATSGLPHLKAFLNGVEIPGLLDFKTLLAKTVGVTFVVATGLPLGREGPMVHTGAIVAARVTCAEVRWPFRWSTPLEVRVPSAQRDWVGVGAAAGVAAAFNSPLGGILYSFEEVCSHWSEKMTWKSFVCVVVSAVTYNLLIRALMRDGGGVQITQGLVLGINNAAYTYPEIKYHEFLFFALIGVLGGLLGAAYVRGVVGLNSVRRKLLKGRQRMRVLETVVLSFVVFSIVFVFPFAFSCQKCAYGMDCYAGYSSSYANGSVTASASGRRLAGGGATLTFVQWNCDTYHYNPMATLLHSGQEGLIKHLLERSNAVSGDASLDWSVMLPFLCLYIVLAIGIFGIFVPSGNFIPAMTIGAGLGRLFGLLVASWFRTSFPAEVIDVGLYGLIGAAAMLAGVTRMTITIAVILVEITDDAMSVLPMMLVVTCAKFTADLLSPSFDHAMIHLNKLPFLDEEPPREYDVLCARDVMTRKVIILREKERVRDLLAVLQRTSHNGFPIVGGGSNDAEARAPGDSGQRATEPGAAFFAGLILRRQLLVLLSERVWSEQATDGFQLAGAARNKFADSAVASVGSEPSWLQIPESEQDALIDLRPFMDPSPYVVTELMPLRRVYRLFNEIGVRHLTVIDGRERVVGLITRKDILPGTIEERVLADDHLAEVEDALKVIEGALQQGLTTLSTKGSKGAGRGLAKGVAAAADGREVPNGGGNPPPLRLRAAASGPSPRSPVQV